jgi:hypothetical protein
VEKVLDAGGCLGLRKISFGKMKSTLGTWRKSWIQEVSWGLRKISSGKIKSTLGMWRKSGMLEVAWG